MLLMGRACLMHTSMPMRQCMQPVTPMAHQPCMVLLRVAVRCVSVQSVQHRGTFDRKVPFVRIYMLRCMQSDWFAKHRGKKPAVAVALVNRSAARNGRQWDERSDGAKGPMRAVPAWASALHACMHAAR